MTHAHLTSIGLSLILFVIIVILQNQGKKIKIWQMGLRASYLLIIATGGMLFYPSPLYMAKAAIGILLIGLFEMVVVRKEKGKSADMAWISFAAVFMGLLIFGFMLPMGIVLF